MDCNNDNRQAVKLTKFQRHVLLVLRAIGPASYDQIRKHCRQPLGVKKAVYRLRAVGLVCRVGSDTFDRC